MTIYSLKDFKVSLEHLRKKNAYRSIEADLIELLFDKTVEELKAGTCLNQSNETPYIKRRINGSGGYRVYYLLIIREDNLYLMYIHPKTGPFGSPNLKSEAITDLYKEVLKAITDDDLYLVTLSENRKSLLFEDKSERKK